MTRALRDLQQDKALQSEVKRRARSCWITVSSIAGRLASTPNQQHPPSNGQWSQLSWGTVNRKKRQNIRGHWRHGLRWASVLTVPSCLSKRKDTTYRREGQGNRSKSINTGTRGLQPKHLLQVLEEVGALKASWPGSEKAEASWAAVLLSTARDKSCCRRNAAVGEQHGRRAATRWDWQWWRPWRGCKLAAAIFFCPTPSWLPPGAEGRQPSKPTWVSVQDVVLNSLRPSTQPSQPLPELSHFYQTHKQQGVLLMSLWFLLVCHALTQNDAESPVSIFLLTFTKAIKNTCPHKKSLHQDMVCLFK